MYPQGLLGTVDPKPPGRASAVLFELQSPEGPAHPGDWAHPPSLEHAYWSSGWWGKGTRTSAAQRPLSPALYCLRGGESEHHAPSAPPPPDFSLKPAFSGSLSPQEFWILPATVLGVQRPKSHHIAQRRQITLEYIVSPAKLCIPILRPRTKSHLIRLHFQITLGFTFQTSSPAPRPRQRTLPGIPFSRRRLSIQDSVPLGPGFL